MRSLVTSSHVAGEYRNNLLRVRIQTAGDVAVAVSDLVVTFSVPPDFHTHNDSVAAAVLTLLGRRSRQVEFNFPISPHCAELLRAYYGLEQVGPVSTEVQSRVPGPALGLNFSGGLDSLALWVLLRDLPHLRLRIVSTVYQDMRYERIAQAAIPRDVISKTNLRLLHLDQAGRFNCAVPLLFADYAGLGAVTNGHSMVQYPFSYERLDGGQPPAFLLQDKALHAGGLAEWHVVRCLCEPALLKIAAGAVPESLEPALRSGSAPGSWKYMVKALGLRYFLERARRPLPPVLHDIAILPPEEMREISHIDLFRTLWLNKRYGRAFMADIDPFSREADLRFLDDLCLDFFERYNTTLLALPPDPPRRMVQQRLHAFGILPYNERDYAELEVVRQFMIDNNEEVVARSLQDRLGISPAFGTFALESDG